MAIEKSNLTNLEHKGDYFTRNNKHENDMFMKEKLDRAFANPE